MLCISFVFLADIVCIFVRLLKEPENFLHSLSWSPLHKGTGELVGESWVYLSQFITPGNTALKKIFPPPWRRRELNFSGGKKLHIPEVPYLWKEANQ